jgi:hypothetical protein
MILLMHVLPSGEHVCTLSGAVVGTVVATAWWPLNGPMCDDDVCVCVCVCVFVWTGLWGTG